LGKVVLDKIGLNKVNTSKSALKEQIDLSLLITNYFNDDPAYRYLYPNGFKNMGNRVGGTLGFENRGALPDWMTSPQSDGRVVGFVNAFINTSNDADEIFKIDIDVVLS
jgi:hypothetical protein